VSRGRLLLGSVAILIALNIASRAVEIVYPEPGGPPSSAYATAADGFAAYAELLRREGHEVDRSQEQPRELEVAPLRTTVVIADAGVVEEEDAKALRRLVERGARLVAVGPAFGWLRHVVATAPEWDPTPVPRPRVLAPRGELAHVRRLEGNGVGAWSAPGATLPLLGDEERSLLTLARVGAGEALLLADVGPLRNDTLARADNAALALALAGPPSRRVVFLESYHGFGGERGFAAIPTSWVVTLGGMLLATLAFMLARGRRLGPPEAATRELAPPRRVYVESLGTLLARTRRPAEASEPLRARALETVERLGCSAEERHKLEHMPTNADELLRYGRTAASLERRVGRRR